MQYMIANQKGEVFADGVTEDNIEETIHSKSQGGDIAFVIAAQLSVSFSAKVVRAIGKPEIIEIESGGKVIKLFRDTDINSGDLGCSCSPEGSEATVDTFNIAFRDHNDDLTDRGIVWVCPGNPASMQLVIKRKALETPRKVQEILEEAKSAMAEKLLDKIDLALL